MDAWREILRKILRNRPNILRIRREMVYEAKSLEQTAAGAVMTEGIQGERTKKAMDDKNKEIQSLKGRERERCKSRQGSSRMTWGKCDSGFKISNRGPTK